MGGESIGESSIMVLAAWGITTLLPYYYEYVSPYLWGSCSWNSFGMLYYFAGFNGYLLLGHYLGKRTDWSLGKTFSVTVPLFLVGYFITLAGFRYMTSDPNVSEEGMELFFTYCSPNALLMTLPFSCWYGKYGLLRRLFAVPLPI